MKTILKTDRGIESCFICELEYGLELHHCFFGNKNKKISDSNGFLVKLCYGCHRTNENAVHKNRNTDLHIKKHFQRIYEETHTREEFIKLIGRSYIGVD